MTAPKTKQATIIITVDLKLIDLTKVKYAKKLKLAYAEKCQNLSDRGTFLISSFGKRESTRIITATTITSILLILCSFIDNSIDPGSIEVFLILSNLYNRISILVELTAQNIYVLHATTLG